MILTGMDGYAQLIAVLVVFAVVLAITAVVTKYIARYQKAQGTSGNIEVLETVQIAPGKYIQLVRLGKIYAAIAVCKDTVTMLCQISGEQIDKRDMSGEQGLKFREFLGNMLRKDADSKLQGTVWQCESDMPQEPEGEQTDDCDQ
ncbi:MAG: flagellar biosynthetic protein FliO [bacterium]|nr:flagellar biosynthetic protein FliO [bacterium]MCM1375632.1 flagellar biosynthetic protein FliO [Muribaculum sp.]